MGREIDDLREKYHRKMLDARAIDRILNTHEFDEAAAYASDIEISKLKRLLPRLDAEALRQWMFDVLYEQLEILSYNRLREMGKNMNIFRWSRLSKDELIMEIKINVPSL